MVMRNFIKKILREEVEGKRAIPLKYYGFDWDDNILFMPTRIYVKTSEGEEIGMGTEPFAHYRSKIGKEDFEYEGHTIVGYADEPYRDFVGDFGKFEGDVQKAKNAPSWNDLVEAINEGQYLAIITARGHEPSVLRQALKTLIQSNRDGISKEKLYESIKGIKELTFKEIRKPDEELESYLDNCMFYTVAYYYPGGASKPEEIKVQALNKFQREMQDRVNKINTDLEKRGVDYYFVPSFGFSDDDRKNVEYMAKKTKGVNVYYTGPTKTGEISKKLVKPADVEVEDDFELQLENKIRKILINIIK